ncbi:hypothetical protein MRX96_046872 [Rhipicephalus microplus]
MAHTAQACLRSFLRHGFSLKTNAIPGQTETNQAAASTQVGHPTNYNGATFFPRPPPTSPSPCARVNFIPTPDRKQRAFWWRGSRKGRPAALRFAMRGACKRAPARIRIRDENITDETPTRPPARISMRSCEWEGACLSRISPPPPRSSSVKASAEDAYSASYTGYTYTKTEEITCSRVGRSEFTSANRIQPLLEVLPLEVRGKL